MRSLFELLKNNDEQIDEFLKHPRHKMLDEIYRLVNSNRKSAGYKSLPMKIYAMKTAHLSLDDLGFLLKRMQQSLYPAKVFFGALKIK